MRPFFLFISFVLILTLTACGSEDELSPPTFSNIMLNGLAVSSTPFKDTTVTITGNMDDYLSTLVVNTTVTGEVTTLVNGSDGSWTFTFSPQEGANIVTLTASDKRGNTNQMILTLVHDSTPPLVTAVVPSADSLQLLVTFNETLADLQPTAVFAVDGTSVTGATLDTVLTHRIFTLPVSVALGPHQLTCSGVVDLAGNSVAVGYTFDFTIE